MALLYVTGQPTNPRTPWRRNLMRAVVVATAAAAMLMSIPVVFGTPQPQVHIRWRGISDEDRIVREQRFGLTEPARLDGGEWSYVPTDTSPRAAAGVFDRSRGRRHQRHQSAHLRYRRDAACSRSAVADCSTLHRGCPGW